MLIATDDNRIIDTDQHSSETRYAEEIVWNGWEMVGRCSQFSDQDTRQILYPKEGRYYLVAFTADNKSRLARRLSEQSAVKWLLANNHHDLPENLMRVAQSLC